MRHLQRKTLAAANERFGNDFVQREFGQLERDPNCNAFIVYMRTRSN